jgi:mono/diheme cytochrome c family protein
MKISTLMLCTLLLPLSLHAEPFAKSDPKAGKLAFDEANCNACHAGRMGGDGNRMFTRPERRVKDAPALLKQVRFCVNQTGANVFPEDIEHIAAYLNQQFYKFK